MSRVFIVIALVCALVAAAFGFGIFEPSGDPHTLGWFALAFSFYVAADLVP